MIDKLLTEHHLEILSLQGGCRGSSESTLVKMSNFWKSHAVAHLVFSLNKCCLIRSPFAAPLKICSQPNENNFL